MSADVAAARQGRIRAEAGLGVVIRVTDGRGKDWGSAIGRLDVPVPEGLYAVGWSVAGSDAESVVRVVDGGETVVRPPWADTRQERRAEVDAFDLMTFGLTASGGQDFLISTQVGSSRYIDRSSLIVELLNPDGGPVDDLAGKMHVLDGGDREVDQIASDLIPGFRGRRAWADVTPGRYRLRFRAQSGETLDQVVPVLKDRTTIVRMQVGTATVMVHGSEGFTNTRSRGVDPARTVVITSGVRDAREGFDEHCRLARLLLGDLAMRRSSLSKGFLEQLEEPGSDPLMRVYGALVIISCLEAGSPPALDEEWPHDGPQAALAIRRWCRRASDLLDNASRAGMPPDAIAGLWQIERLVGPGKPSGSRRIPASIRMPPMLECAWRWAVARTTIDRNALQDFAGIRAAAKSAGGTSPWLCWSAAAAKGLQNPTPSASDDELDALLRKVVDKARTLRQRQERSPSDLLFLPHSLPAEASATALRAEQVLERSDKSRSASEVPVAALALALSLPLAALAARLILTDRALDEALAEAGNHEPRRVDDDKNQDAPGWRKKVRFKDDSNRGRFGGLAERDGFRLEADFSHTKSKNWATIYLRIVGPPGFDGAAVIYLHNSFKPSLYRYRFEDGVVRDKLTAWGGFTVAAWIPSRRIELELNLAEVDGAPRIIRER